MQPLFRLVPRAALFLAGIAAGALTASRRDGTGSKSASLDAFEKSLADLEKRLSDQQSGQTVRFDRIEARLDEHAVRLNEHTARLADVPSTGQIVAAMEQLLQKTMGSLDDRLSAQAHSIEVLKTTVSQTDSLLERVLESLDSLQSYSDPSEAGDNPVPVRRT